MKVSTGRSHIHVLRIKIIVFIPESCEIKDKIIVKSLVLFLFLLGDQLLHFLFLF